MSRNLRLPLHRIMDAIEGPLQRDYKKLYNEASGSREFADCLEIGAAIHKLQQRCIDLDEKLPPEDKGDSIYGRDTEGDVFIHRARRRPR